MLNRKIILKQQNKGKVHEDEITNWLQAIDCNFTLRILIEKSVIRGKIARLPKYYLQTNYLREDSDRLPLNKLWNSMEGKVSAGLIEML